jgi:hypothetical protein
MENEMYSWAGENRFSNRDLFEFVRDGAVSTGSFTSMLTSIFGNNAARFAYDGDSMAGGRLLSEFGFHIAQERSTYLYIFGATRAQHVPMAYDGTVFVDPETLDLVRLRIRTAQPPPETGVCELVQSLEYTRTRLNGTDFLLPSEARVSVIHTDGTEADNRIQYSACHEFRGESTVRYEPADQAEGSSPDRGVPATPFSLPPGLPFKVAFTDRIDAQTAAAGDPIRGRLKTAIRDRSDKGVGFRGHCRRGPHPQHQKILRAVAGPGFRRSEDGPSRTIPGDSRQAGDAGSRRNAPTAQGHV